MSATARTIGYWGSVATLVGYVIGASIFVLPAQLLPDTGPAVFLSYLLAGIPAVFTCVAGAVVGNALPVTGASYVAVRRCVSPFAGFSAAWLITVAAALGLALVAYGFADYARYFVPSLDARWTALAVVALFGVVNLTRVSLTVAVQGVMVIVFLTVIVAFAAGGLVRGDWSRLAPLLPNGFAPVATGALAAYFSFAGLQVLIDIGGEIRDPARTIPRALATSFAVIFVVYVAFVLSLALVLPWEDVGSATAAAGRAAAIIFPGWFATAVVVSALLAAVTSINGVLFTQARDIQALAADGYIPAALAARSEATGVPGRAVVALTALAMLAVSRGASVRDYAVTTAMCMMAVQALLGAATWRLPRALPEAWRASPFRLSLGAHRFFSGGLVVVSLVFFTVGVLQSRSNALAFAALWGVGGVYYAGRRTVRRPA